VSPINELTDAEIDALLPDAVRRRSPRFWTPVAVARRVGHLLAELRCRRALDVGSGPGKFSVVAAVRAPDVEFVGIEHRPHLVEVARTLAAELRIGNVKFEVGDATSVSWSAFDAFYVFNSFAENVFSHHERFDDTVLLSPRRRLADLLRVERLLSAVPDGAVLVTYHGLGGPIPGDYECLLAEDLGRGWLRVWRKGPATAGNKTYWLEEDEGLCLVTARELEALLLQQSSWGPDSPSAA
jgi:SAM-dependent methyltransferase